MKSISIRVKGAAKTSRGGQQSHDIRKGRQPGYVDNSRRADNSIIMTPWSDDKLSAICEHRRFNQGGKKRKMKSTSHIAMNGIITFSAEAQPIIYELLKTEQDKLFKKVARAISAECETSLTGLVVHRDESAIHAHFQILPINKHGQPLTKSGIEYSRLQDIAGECVNEYGITRGKKKSQRIADGEPDHKHINRSVNQLHRDLIPELAEMHEDIALASERLLARENDLKRAEIALLERKVLTERSEARSAELTELIGKKTDAIKSLNAKGQGLLERVKALETDLKTETSNKKMVTEFLATENPEAVRWLKKALLYHNDPSLEKELGLEFNRDYLR